MDSMLDLCLKNRYDTDKYLAGSTFWQSPHCYVEHVYSHVFDRMRESCKSLLEIGVYNGGSILLWKDYFPNATIYGVDINIAPALNKAIDRVYTTIGDGYTVQYANSIKNYSFDIIIDDGPHTKESMHKFLQLYSNKVTTNGILVIEDIPDIELAKQLAVESFFTSKAKIYDLRHVSNKFDDIVLVMDLGV